LTKPLQTRALWLLPGRDCDEVRVTLRCLELRDKWYRGIPEYIAISYTWGAPEDKTFIRCDAGYPSIPRNLLGALGRMRFRRLARRIWADSICINQDGHTEREQQVALMTRIYANAKLVMIWLGEHCHLSRLGCNIIDDMIEYFLSDKYDWDNPVVESLLEPGASEKWQALIAFFERDWFGRAWVFQEAAMARQALFLLDDWMTHWKGVELVVNRLVHQGGSLNPIGRRDTSKLATIFYIEKFRVEKLVDYDRRLDVFDDSLSGLIYVLNATRNLQATDPRDKIFALRGLSQEREGERYPVDYRSTTEEVYQKFALYELFQGENLNVLSCVTETSRSIPSWVPDWTEPLHEGPPMSSDHFHADLDAGGDRANNWPILSLSENGQMLTVRSRRVSQIKELGTTTPRIPQGTINQVHDLKSSFLQETYDLTATLPELYHTSHTRLEAFLRTLVWDTIGKDPG